jgi:hypothetical protein
MKPTLIRMPALLPVLLLSSQIVQAADPVPKFDTGPSCRSAAVVSAVIATRDAAGCERDESTARDTLEKEWSEFTPSDQARCVRLVTLGGGPSYVELLTCLEMAKQVKELPGADQMDNSGTVEKSRHAK